MNTMPTAETSTPAVVNPPTAPAPAPAKAKAKAKVPTPAPTPATLPAFVALASSLPAPGASPKASLDAVLAWGEVNGMPGVRDARAMRDGILSRVPHLTGKVRWTAGGTAATAKAAIVAAAKEVAKHAATDGEGEREARGLRAITRLFAVAAALGESADITLA